MLDEKEPEFHFRIILEDTETRIEHIYKEAYNPNSEHDLAFPALPAKFDAIIAALKASGHSEKDIKADMIEYLEWEGDVWVVLRKVEDEIGNIVSNVHIFTPLEFESRLRDILKMIEEAA